MKVYIYDNVTGEFLYSSDAQENPKRNGEYLYPPNSTRVTPPVANDKEVAIFTGEYWKILEDFRGLKQINLETLEITKVNKIGKLEDGYMLYSDYVLTDMYREALLKQQRDEQKNEILSQIREIDEKRIRAICEPSVKDSITGETWLDYYNSKIFVLRERLLEVENDT